MEPAPYLVKTCFFMDTERLRTNKAAEAAERPAIAIREITFPEGAVHQSMVVRAKANEIILRCPCCLDEVARFRSDYNVKKRPRRHPLRKTPVVVWLETESAVIEIVGDHDLGPTWEADSAKRVRAERERAAIA